MAVLILSVTIKSMQIGGPDCNPAAYREALSGYVINRLKTKIGMHRDTRLSHALLSWLIMHSLKVTDTEKLRQGLSDYSAAVRARDAAK